MKTVDIEAIMSWKPCCTRERIEEIFSGRDLLSVEDILELNIPSKEKFWALARPHFTTERVLRLTECRCALRAISIVGNTNHRGLHAIEMAERYAEGCATEMELSEAARVAWAEAVLAEREEEAAVWATSLRSGAALWAARVAGEAAEPAERDEAMAAAWNSSLDDLCKLTGWT